MKMGEIVFVVLGACFCVAIIAAAFVGVVYIAFELYCYAIGKIAKMKKDGLL